MSDDSGARPVSYGWPLGLRQPVARPIKRVETAHQQPSVVFQLDDVLDRQFAHSRRRLSPGQNV